MSVQSVLTLVFLLAYPLIAYVSIRSLGLRLASLLILLVLFGSTLLKILTARSLLKPLLMQVGAVALILGAGALLDDPLFMKLVPTFIALSAASNFFLSLRRTPIIESFARIEKPRLPADEVAYTRRVTHLWGWTMAADALLCLAAALQPSLKLWLLLCFPVSYGLIGLVFASEYCWRKRRFGGFNDALVWDRLLRIVLKR